MRKACWQPKGVIAIFLFIVWLATSSCGGNSRGVPAVDRTSNPSATTATTNAEQAKLQLGGFQELAGTDYLMAAIGTPQEREYSSKGSDIGYTRNYLFVNLDDKSSHLLLPTNDFLLLSAENLPEESPAKPAPTPAKNPAPPSQDNAGEKPKTTVKWICYRLIKADTDNDKRLTANDLITIALSDASGLNYTELIGEVQAVLHQVRRGDKLLFIYREKGQNRIAEIDLQTKQVGASKDLQEMALK